MKKLVLFFSLFIVYKVIAQETYVPKYIAFDDQMQSQYVNNDKNYIVIEVPGKSQEEIYTLVLRYLQKNSNDVNKTVKSNIPNTSIKYMFFNKASDYVVVQELYKRKKISYSIKNTYGVYVQTWIELEFKPGKIKFQISGYNIFNDQGIDGIGITNNDVVVSRYDAAYTPLQAGCANSSYDICTANSQGKLVLNSRVQEGLNLTFDWYVLSLLEFINNNNSNW